jgi:hypothetical protein
MIRTLLLAAFPLVVAAETPGLGLSGPVLGYVFDEASSAIRPIAGVPGAAGLDQTVSLGAALEAAWIHSGSRVAVVITKDGALAVANWRETPGLTGLESGLARVTHVAFAPGGGRAALSDGVGVELWSNLRGEPRRDESLAPAGGVAALALRADGALALATGDGSVLLHEDGASRTIAVGGAWSALAFAGDDLLAADAGELVRISGNGGRSVVAAFSGPAGGLAVSRDGSLAALALSEDLLLVNLSGDSVPVACGCSARALAALEGNLVLYLAGAEGAVRVLDADATRPRVLEIHQ